MVEELEETKQGSKLQGIMTGVSSSPRKGGGAARAESVGVRSQQAVANAREEQLKQVCVCVCVCVCV